MERAKYIKQGMISSIQYLKLFTDPGFAYHSLHILDRFSFRSFPSSRVAVRVNLLLFVFEGPSEALGVLTNPLSEDAPALFCFSHTFFVPSHPHLLPGSRQKMPATNRKASSQPIPDSISFSSLEIHHVTQIQTRPGPG